MYLHKIVCARGMITTPTLVWGEVRLAEKCQIKGTLWQDHEISECIHGVWPGSWHSGLNDLPKVLHKGSLSMLSRYKGFYKGCQGNLFTSCLAKSSFKKIQRWSLYLLETHCVFKRPTLGLRLKTFSSVFWILGQYGVQFSCIWLVFLGSAFFLLSWAIRKAFLQLHKPRSRVWTWFLHTSRDPHPRSEKGFACPSLAWHWWWGWAGLPSLQFQVMSGFPSKNPSRPDSSEFRNKSVIDKTRVKTGSLGVAKHASPAAELSPEVFLCPRLNSERHFSKRKLILN